MDTKIVRSVVVKGIRFFAQYDSADNSFLFYSHAPENSAWNDDYVLPCHLHMNVSPFALLPALRQEFIWRAN